jgi:hypothetical protein
LNCGGARLRRAVTADKGGASTASITGLCDGRDTRCVRLATARKWVRQSLTPPVARRRSNAALPTTSHTTCTCQRHDWQPPVISLALGSDVALICGGARLRRAVTADEGGARGASITGYAVGGILTAFASLRSKVGSTESHPTCGPVAQQRRPPNHQPHHSHLPPTRLATASHRTGPWE